ncbi:uncharacterized protein LOC130918837 [Corythoichthys intestinalis]|uniref:uncharacterized protein LOC130918837 n=1 Tax=Corythoichthys intestinalis TaxID=161448 RepID=UPI0025A527F1|nr:uncharacterized protein LOC130918837 [Corythoichthys intestinalis]
MTMCAISVKEEYEEEICRFKVDDEGQLLTLDAVFKTPRVGSHRADVSKNIFPEQQDSECPDIKKEEAPGHHHCEESQAYSPIAPTSHSSDTDNEQSKGSAPKSDYTGITTNAGIECGNENTEQPLPLTRKTLDVDRQSEADSFSYSEESYPCEMNTGQQSPLSLEMLEEEQRQAEDSFSCVTESFVCQMHKPRSSKNIHGRELPQHQRDLIVERYQSGDGYKRISKALNIPWNTVKSVLVRWRKNGTTVTLPRTGRPSKIDEKTRKELVKEAVKRPTATLKELQEFLASTGCSVHATTISRILHKYGLWGRVAR